MPIVRIVALLSVFAAASVAAQGAPPAAGPRRAPGPAAAQMLLAQTGELELTDAQVVRLAAIARRSEGRRRAMQASMDSARTRIGQPGDSVARRQFGERMRADMQRAQGQMEVDQRDAIAVLTADQQAKAWTMVANRGQRGMRGPQMRGPQMRDRGPEMRARPGMRGRAMRDVPSPRRGPDNVRPMRPMRPE